MKKVLFSLMVVLFAAGFAAAQEDGAKLAKSAGKALTSYNIDPSGNAAKLDEAKEKINQALKTPEAQAMVTAWMTQGDVYNTLLQKDMARRMIDPKAPLSGDNDALVAFDAYKKAYELSTKKYEKGDAVKGMAEVQPHMINIGVAKYEAKDFEKAFLAFKGSIECHDILKENSQKSVLDDPKQYDDQLYFTGLLASMSNRCSDAVVYYDKLMKKGTDNAAVYEGLYNCKSQMGDQAGADMVLAEGRKKFPEDPALLFAEINAYLKSGRLGELTGRLEQAIKQEPTNVGLYVTLGNVYDNLLQGALKEKNDAKATEYFDLAMNNYSKGLSIDPKNVDANYSLGALYFNKAAVRTQEMNALPDDFSNAGLKKMEAIKNEIMGLFDKALPYFQKAENLDPNDINTLIALSEIYARKDDETLAQEFKKRLDAARSDKKNTGSYFKQ